MSPALRTRSDQVRDAYSAHMAYLFDRADEVTAGYLVNQVAAARGVTGPDLFWPGRGRAHESCASTELREAWDRGLCERPVSFGDFRAANYPDPRAERAHMDEYLGYAEAAELLGLKAKSLREYRARGVLPEPDLIVSGRPAWKRLTLTRWDAARKVRNAAHRHEPVDWSAVGF